RQRTAYELFTCLEFRRVLFRSVVFRALQTTGFGEFSFALSYPALFTAFATLGVHRLLIRDIARDPQIAWREAWAALTLVTILSEIGRASCRERVEYREVGGRTT